MTYFHPQRMPALRAARREAARLQLEQHVARSRTTRRRAKPMAISAGVALLVLSGGAAAFAVAGYQPVMDLTHARCYTVTRTGGSYATVGVAGRAGSAAEARSALEMCSSLFRQGWLRLGASRVTPPVRTGHPHPVPPLGACAMAGEVVAVFPGGADSCAELGLRPAAGRSGVSG
jgi:hypothetical protein